LEKIDLPLKKHALSAELSIFPRQAKLIVRMPAGQLGGDGRTVSISKTIAEKEGNVSST
jgi:hypothetical protein